MQPSPSGFDKLARPYQWLEYMTFGPLLMRTRQEFLPRMLRSRRALVLGDGDGRFCAALLGANAEVSVHAVDSSAAMLKALRTRATGTSAEDRVTTHLQDVRDELPQGPFDLLCTHFLLDCLNETEIAGLAEAAAARCAGGLWVISEFAIPDGMARWPARLLVRSLYAAFGLLAGLRARRLPRHARALQAAGFSLVDSRTRLCGILRSELWIAAGAGDLPACK